MSCASISAPGFPLNNHQVGQGSPDRRTDARSLASTEGRTGREALGIPTVITDESRRSKALQVVDSEGEITFFDRATSRLLFDAEAENLQRWLMLRQAQQILLHDPEAFELRGKWDMVPYSVFNPEVGRVFGPVHQRHARTERLSVESDGSTGQLKRLQPKFRTVLCLQRHVPGRDASVWQSRESKNCSWHDVTVCGSPWTCPICAKRISKARQEQIKAVYDAMAKVGGSSYMLTFTIRHGIGDDCAELVTKMKEAMQHLQKTQAWKAATRAKALKRPQEGSIPFLEYLGRIAALEVTHGANGWHPHEHHLWFFKKSLTVREVAKLKDQLFDAWALCCVRVGLQAPLRKYGLDIRQALSAAEYIAKFAELGLERRWGPEKEIASSHVKKANGKGRSVMQILSDSLGLDAGTDSEQQRFQMNRDCFLFLDFARAFLGKHQLQMSRTLKAWLRKMGIDLDESEQGDLVLAEALEADSELQFELSASDFLCVVRNKAQAAVLQTCKHLGADAALAFVRSLPGWIDAGEHDHKDFRSIDMECVVDGPDGPMGLMQAKKFKSKNTFVPYLDTFANHDFLRGRDLDYWRHMGRDESIWG